MKAIVYRKYGSPDVIELVEREKPSPQGNEVLVKVVAAAVNPLDWRLMRATPFLVRTSGGLFKPKDPRLGADLAGVVEAVGPAVTTFKPGDEVFGLAKGGTGAFAEFGCARETNLALKPVNTSFESAASVGVAGLTALQGLRDKGKIQSGQNVLINGASGGVGTFAVQFAKYFGAEVTGVCSTTNVELVRSIGADHVIDYKKEDFTRNSAHYDLIFDAVANHSVFDYKRSLSDKGICTVAGFSTVGHMALFLLTGSLVSMMGEKKIGFMGMAKANSSDLTLIGELLEAGKIVPVIDRRYVLGEVADAIRYLEAGHAKGKVVITVTGLL